MLNLAPEFASITKNFSTINHPGVPSTTEKDKTMLAKKISNARLTIPLSKAAQNPQAKEEDPAETIIPIPLNRDNSPSNMAPKSHSSESTLTSGSTSGDASEADVASETEDGINPIYVGTSITSCLYGTALLTAGILALQSDSPATTSHGMGGIVVALGGAGILASAACLMPHILTSIVKCVNARLDSANNAEGWPEASAYDLYRDHEFGANLI